MTYGFTTYVASLPWPGSEEPYRKDWYSDLSLPADCSILKVHEPRSDEHRMVFVLRRAPAVTAPDPELLGFWAVCVWAVCDLTDIPRSDWASFRKYRKAAVSGDTSDLMDRA